jgi:hypothetical protein
LLSKGRKKAFYDCKGLKPKDCVLPPRIVKFIAEKFCIDVE